MTQATTPSPSLHAPQRPGLVDRLRDGAYERWIVAALLVVVALPYVFSGALDSDYVFDDKKLVRDNPAIRDLSQIGAAFNIFSDRWRDAEVRPNYRPVRFLSYAIDYAITRAVTPDFDPDDPPTWVFHTTNLLLHLLNVALVYAIGRRLFGRGWTPAVLALLFGLHPVQTEAVVYISGRRDVLSLAFFLAALRLYLGSAARPVFPFPLTRTADVEPQAAARRGDASWLAVLLCPVLFALGLLTKEMVVTLPAVLLLVDLARRAAVTPRRLVVHAILWSLAIAFTLFKSLDTSLVARPVGGDIDSTLLTAPRYVLHYLRLLFAPLDQSIDYSYNAIPISRDLLTPWTTLPALVLVVALLVAGTWALWRRRALLAIGVLWFLGTLVPVLQIVPIPERFAERFLYLPGLGIFLLLAAIYCRWERSFPLHARVTYVVALVLAFGATWARSSDWQTPLSLWESAASARPRSARAHIGHANVLRDLEEHHKAARAYSRAIAILAEDPRGLREEPLRFGHLLQARNFRADVFMRLGASDVTYYERAIEDFRWLLEQTDVDGVPVARSQRHLVLHHHLAESLLAAGKVGEAVLRFEKLIDVARSFSEPTSATRNFQRAAHYRLATIHRAAQRRDEALREFAAAYSLARTVRERYRLVGEYADLRVALEQYDAALELLQPVIDAMGDDPDRKHLIFRVARIQNLQGDVAAAAATLEEALAIDADFAPALLSLASLEESRGHLDRAETLLKQVEKLAPGSAEVAQALARLRVKRDVASRPENVDEREKQRSRLSALLDQAHNHRRLGELFAAQSVFEQVVRTPAEKWNQPFRGEALRGLGLVAQRLRRLDDAEGFFERSLEVDPGAHNPHLNLADLALEHRGDRERARKHYELYVDHFRDDAPGVSHAYYNLAHLVKEAQPERATRLLELARKAGHEPAQVERSLGEVCVLKKQWAAALEHFGQYLELEDDPAERARVEAYVNQKVVPRLLDASGGEGTSDGAPDQASDATPDAAPRETGTPPDTGDSSP